MIQFLRDLLAAPFRVLALLFGLFPFLNPIVFHRIVWRLSGDQETARELLIRTHKQQGLKAAELLADTLLADRPEALIVVIVGGLILRDTKDAVRVQALMRKARLLNCLNEPLLLWLEAVLCDCIQPDQNETIITAILSRNDLPMSYTQMALIRHAEFYLRSQDWDRAEAICDRIYYVDKSQAVEWFYYVIDVARHYQEDNTVLSRILAKIKDHKHAYLNHAVLCWYVGDYKLALGSLKMAYDNGITENELWSFNPGFSQFASSLEEKERVV